jgi:putative peptidoglycan lipid II flippase
VSNPIHTPNVARAGLIMMGSILLSRVLGLVRVSVQSAMFGRGPDTDAYGLAFQIPDLLFFLIAGGALSSAFIPVFSEYLHTERERDAWEIFSVVTTVMTLVVSAFVLFASFYAEPLIQLMAPGKSADLFPLIAHMSRILLPAQIAFFIGGLMFGTLYARQVFAIPGLGPNVYNVGIIVGAIALSRFFEPGIIGMAWGALVGACIGNLVIPLVAMLKMGSHFRPSLNLRHPGVKKVFILMAPVVFGLSLPGVYAVFMRGFGSLYSVGVNTALDLSNVLMQAPLGVFGQSLAIAIFPALSQFYAQGRMDRYSEQLSKTLRQVIYLTVPISALMLAGAQDIVTVLCQYGKFKGADTQAVAQCLEMFTFGITAWCMHPVLMRGFFAAQKSLTPVVLGTLTTAVFYGLMCLLRIPLGYLGLPLASSIAATFLAALLLWKVKGVADGIDYKGILRTLAFCVAASAAVYGAVALGVHLLPTSTGLKANLVSAIRLGVFGLVGVWVYYGITKRLKMPETGYLDRAFSRSKAKSGRG